MPQLNGIHPGNNIGAHDRLACRVCGAVMYLIRRTPHADFGQSFERQTFRCVSCQKEIERYADGHPLTPGRSR